MSSQETKTIVVDRADIKRIVDYLYDDEAKSFEDWIDCDGDLEPHDVKPTHIFETIMRLEKVLKA